MPADPLVPLSAEEIVVVLLRCHNRFDTELDFRDYARACEGNRRYLALCDGVRELVESAESDGCLTGDCPHEYQAGCDAALPRLFLEVLRDLRALLPDAPPEVTTNV